MRKLLIILSLTCYLSFFCAAESYGCTCGTIPLVDEVDGSDAVFLGDIKKMELLTEKEYQAETGNDPFPPTYIKVTFTVKTLLKGNLTNEKEAVVYTAGNSGACGYSFSFYSSYLVYAGVCESGFLHTSMCARTKPLQATEWEDVADLKEHKKMVKDEIELVKVIVTTDSKKEDITRQ